MKYNCSFFQKPVYFIGVFLLLLFTSNGFYAQTLITGGVATQSTTGFMGTADRAIDGNTNGFYSNGSVSHTAGGDPAPSWQHDLGSNYSISNVTIWHRTDSCCTNRSDDFILEILDASLAVVFTYTHPGSPGVSTNVNTLNTTGRYVRIRLVGPSRLLQLAEVQSFTLDADGDTILDTTDIDDDNDGILDTEEVCGNLGGVAPQSDAIIWEDDSAAYQIYAIGSNTNGLGYRESGFEQEALGRGFNLTYPTNNDFSLPNTVSDGTATTTTGTFANGNLSYTAEDFSGSNAEVDATGNRRSQFNRTTDAELISGTGGDAIRIKPPIRMIQGESYTVTIDFTNPVTSFSFDLNDILDSNIITGVEFRYEIFADGQLIAFFNSPFFGNDTVSTVTLFRGDNSLAAHLPANAPTVGNATEFSIGIIPPNPISIIEIKHTLVNGNIVGSTNSDTIDLHSIDSFVYSTNPRNCFASNRDFDGDGLENDKDIDSDNDGIPDNVEAQSTLEYIPPTGNVGANGLDSAYENNDTLSATGLAQENTDGDIHLDYLDLNSDNDTLLDIEENGMTNTVTTDDTDNDGLLDVFEGAINNDGFDANDEIDEPNASILPDQDNDKLTVGDVDYRDTHASGIPVISQVYHNGTTRYIEITNIHPTNSILAGSIKFAFYQDEAIVNLTNTLSASNTPDEELFTTLDIPAGESILIKSTDAALAVNATATVYNNQLANFNGGNDIVALTHYKGLANGFSAWKNRYESGHTFSNTTSYVRHDNVTAVTEDFDISQWTAFVNNNLPFTSAGFVNSTDSNVVVSFPQQRSFHDPIITEVIAPTNTNANVYLGVHYTGNTLSSDNFTNGTPDKSRIVEIDSDTSVSVVLNARNLQVNTNRNLTLNATHSVVTGDLINNGNIVLENNISGGIKTTGQLIQTRQGGNTNTGTGNLFVNQTSSIASAESIYRYTYWSSPVAATNNAATYAVGNVMKDPTSTPPSVIDLNFVTGYDGAPGTPTTISNYWIFTYLNGVDNGGFVQQLETGAIPIGAGYLMKGSGNTAGQDFTFVGKPNSGDVPTPAPIAENGNHIIGNPYPSSIDAIQFLYDNSSIIKHGTLYFWQHVGEADATSTVTAGHTQSGYRGGYATRNLSMSVNGANVNGLNSSTGTGYTYNIPGRYIPIGQGFLFTSKEYGDPMISEPARNLVFSNRQRTYQNETVIGLTTGNYGGGNDSHFLGRGAGNKENVARNTNNQFSILRLGFEHNNENNVELHRQLGISFQQGLSFDNDYGHDSPMYDSQLTEIYWKFPSDDTRYLIAGVQELSEDLEVPIDVVIGGEEPVRFMVDGKRNIDYPIFLYDAVDQISYDLTNPTEITLPTGTYTDRFFVTFKAQGTVLNTDKQLANETTIFFNKNSDEIVIKTIKSLEIKKAELFNLLGQSISNWKDISLNSSEKRLKVNKLSTSVYILNLQTDKGKISKKLIIE